MSSLAISAERRLGRRCRCGLEVRRISRHREAGSTTGSQYTVPFHPVDGWALDAAMRFGGPIPLGRLGEVANHC